MVRTITWKTKRKTKKRPIYVQLVKTKERRKLVPFVVGSFFIHKGFNVAFMQIVRSKSNKRSKRNISHQNNLPFYNRG